MNHREIVVQLSPIEIKARHGDTRPEQLKKLAQLLKILGIDVEVTSESSIKHLNPDSSDDELFFLINEVVQRRFPVQT